MAKIQKLTPFLWFDHQAEDAAQFYVSVFDNSHMGSVMRPGGVVLVANFSLDGHDFSALNGGPRFTINPSASMFVLCDTVAEADRIWSRLAEGGQVMIPIERQAWSERYGWVQDRFGFSWQVSVGKLEDIGQRLTPSLLFTGPQRGQAEAALRFYTSVFPDSDIATVLHYEAGEEGPAGSVKFAQFSLFKQSFIAMDNPTNANYTFNEAVSFMVHCDDQAEVDYFWNKLTADGGEESMCGWLKDKFGFSWQIVPDILLKLVNDPDPAKAQRAMQNMMQMRKIEIDQLTAEPDPTAPIMVQTSVNAPIEKVWQYWTDAEHVRLWNHASDDWHTPAAANDLRVGGSFSYTMAARDGSFSFGFGGIYDEVVDHRRIAFTMSDGRKVEIQFDADGDKTHITENFEPETINSRDMQQAGWQAILDNFKKYVEGKH